MKYRTVKFQFRSPGGSTPPHPSLADVVDVDVDVDGDVDDVDGDFSFEKTSSPRLPLLQCDIQVILNEDNDSANYNKH